MVLVWLRRPCVRPLAGSAHRVEVPWSPNLWSERPLGAWSHLNVIVTLSLLWRVVFKVCERILFFHRQVVLVWTTSSKLQGFSIWPKATIGAVFSVVCRSSDA